MNIYLIGYRCTGKTTVGALLGQRLGWSYLDADEELVREQGRTIAEIVATRGWPFFRKLEKEVLKRIGQMDRLVIATGGGVVLDAENIALMKHSGRLIWLRAEPETIHRRLVGDNSSAEFRPALTDKNQFDEIVATLVTRIPLYEGAMDFGVDTDAIPVEQVGQRILDWLKTDWTRTDVT
ncbi:MAG: shikimate kinase [Thermodesulfobacteriota bacterium]